MPVLGERFYQMSNTIFCYDLKPIPLAVYSYLVCCAGQKDDTGQRNSHELVPQGIHQRLRSRPVCSREAAAL